MKIRLSLLTLMFVAAVLGVAVMPRAVRVSAHETGEATSEQTSSESTETDAEEPGYNYHAQSGDSYTKMARKAVQTYGLTNSIELSGAKIVYTETNLTKEAGSPQLDLGQEVYISEATVKAWVEKAMAITPEEEAAWNYYVQFVNFNTDNVGETR